MILGICLISLLCPSGFAQSPAPRHTPEPDRPPLDRGVALAVNGEYEKALRIFQELLHEQPDDPQLNYLAGAACVRLKRLAEGIDYLEKAVRLKAPFPQVYGELCEAYLQRKMQDRARSILEDGLRLFPKNEALKKLRRKF